MKTARMNTARAALAGFPALVAGAAFYACSGPPSFGDGTDSGRRDDGINCTPEDTAPPPSDGAVGTVGGRCNCNSFVKETKLGGVCNAVVRWHPYEGGEHYDPGTSILYCSNPPNSGPHYFIWAAFKTYPKPIPRGFAVHNMEHGAVVLWYRCASSDACTDTASKLQAVVDARPIDPLCIPPDADAATMVGPRRRMLLVPEPTLASPVAASAHQWTYTADCVDPSTLSAFIGAHYGQGVEASCVDGKDPLTIPP